MATILKLITLTGFLLVWTYGAHAQLLPDPLSLSASPSSPSPGETVLIRAATPTFDKNASFFEWTVDGKSRPDFSGTGKDTISVVAGPVGSALRVGVAVSGPGDTGGEESLVIRVSDLALTWFAETYVPRWYKGKALPTQNSIVNIVAVPRVVIGGSTIKPENLIYRWGLDDEEGALSGVGEQTFRIQTSELPGVSHRVSVTVEDSGKQIRKEGEIFIVPARPKVLIYPSTPLGGPEFRSAPAFFSTSVRGLIDFTAEPFYFSVPSKRLLPYAWDIAGGNAVGAAESPFLLSIDTGEQPVSAVPLSVTVKSPETFIAAVSRAITLFLK